jgi:hypothetical protein
MDYYSKYLKYKLKYKNLHKQIGGAFIWQYQLNEDTWQSYDPEESYFIEHHQGTFHLPISKFVVNKEEFYQQGKANRRTIRRIHINDNEMRRFEEEYRVRKTIAILQAFPQILRLDANQPTHTFENSCTGFFNANLYAFGRITTETPAAYAVQNSDLYAEIIRSGTPLTTPDIRRLFALRRARAEEAERIERDRVRPIAAREAAQREEWGEFPGAYF